MFGRKRKTDTKQVPEYSEEGMIAYVYRTKPEKWGKTRIAGSIKGSGFKDVHNPLDLEAEIEAIAGGGEYVVKFFEPGTSIYIAQKKIEIAGPPKHNGEILKEPAEEEKKKKEEVPSVQREIQKEEDAMRLEQIQVKHQKERVKLGLDEDVDDDDDIEEVDTEKETMREENEKLKKELEEEHKHQEREKEERRDREQREREDRRDREHREDMKRLEDKMTNMGTQQNSGGTMDAIKAMISSQAESTKAMLQAMDGNRKDSAERSSEVTRLLLDQSNRMADVQVASAKEAADAKTNQSEHMLGLMEKTWQTALAVGAGRSPTEGPKDLPGVIGDVTGRICDVVTEFIREKGKQAITPEKLTQMIRKTGQDVASGIQRPTRKALPPAAQAANPIDPRAAMNKVLKVFLSEMKAGVEDPTWWSLAERELPGPVMAELTVAAQGGDMEKLVGVVRKYADPGMADEVTELLAQAGKEEVELEPELPEEPSEATPEEAPKEPPKEPPKESPKEPPKESPKAARKPSKTPNKKKR